MSLSMGKCYRRPPVASGGLRLVLLTKVRHVGLNAGIRRQEGAAQSLVRQCRSRLDISATHGVRYEACHSDEEVCMCQWTVLTKRKRQIRWDSDISIELPTKSVIEAH